MSMFPQTLQSNIDRLNYAKGQIKATLEEAGVTVSSAATLDAYPALVSEAIGSGGGGGGGEVENQIVAMEGEEYVNDIQENRIQIGIAYINNGDYTHLWVYEVDGGFPTPGEMPTNPMVYNGIKEDVLNNGWIITRMDDGLGSCCISNGLDGFDYKDIVFFMGTTNSLSDIYTVFGLNGYGEWEEPEPEPEEPIE